MVVAAPGYDVPLHNDEMDVVLIADSHKAAHALSRLAKVMKYIGEQTDFSEAGARAIVDPLNKSGLKVATFAEKLSTVPSSARSMMMRLMEKTLQEQTGQLVPIDGSYASAPLMMFSDRAAYPFTGDGIALMVLRSNVGDHGVARIVPAGFARATVDETGKARPPLRDAERAFTRTLGLPAANFQDVGWNRRDALVEGIVLPSADGTETLAGVMPIVPYIARVRLKESLEAVLPKIGLTEENFGVIGVSLRHVDALVRGKPGVVAYFPSDAAPAYNYYAMASRYEPYTNRFMNGVPEPARLSWLRDAVSNRIADRVDRLAPGEPPYRVGPVQGFLSVEVDDFKLGGRNFLAEMLAAADKAGLEMTPAVRAYARETVSIEPLANRLARPVRLPGRGPG
jgi:hypothetical protein